MVGATGIHASFRCGMRQPFHLVREASDGVTSHQRQWGARLTPLDGPSRLERRLLVLEVLECLAVLLVGDVLSPSDRGSVRMRFDKGVVSHEVLFVGSVPMLLVRSG